MINLDFNFFVLLYVSAGLAVVMALWIYYDLRDQRIYEHESSQAVFHCLKCGRLYTAPHAARAANCPGCNFENSRLKF